jgi:CheY-like chemotaxis protein
MRVGLGVEAAENGKIAVEMVQERVRSDKKPFDLILMDIFMPVMDGIEAATKITALNTGAPIVAMTANVMVSELENYRKHGMPDFLGKPFTSQELWRTLLKFLTPISSSATDKDEHAREEAELLKMLQLNFVKNNQTVFTDIIDAIENSDMVLAHRLAHTLKGNAGQIGKTGLQGIAAEVEALLKNGVSSIPADIMNTLETELARVLEELQPLLDEYAAKREDKQLNVEQTLALFEKIKPLLEKINPGVIDLLDDVRAIPGAEALANQIENFEFGSAVDTLAQLRERIVADFGLSMENKTGETL